MRRRAFAAIVEDPQDVDLAGRQRQRHQTLRGRRGPDNHQVRRQQPLPAQPADIGEPDQVAGDQHRYGDQAQVNDAQDVGRAHLRERQRGKGQHHQAGAADRPDDLVQVLRQLLARIELEGLEAHQEDADEDRSGDDQQVRNPAVSEAEQGQSSQQGQVAALLHQPGEHLAGETGPGAGEARGAEQSAAVTARVVGALGAGIVRHLALSPEDRSGPRRRTLTRGGLRSR